MSEIQADDVEEIQKLIASSPYFSKLADSILTKLDRKTLANIIASYLYFKSKGRTDPEFFRFLLSNDLPEILPVVSLSIPVLLPAIISDRKIRSMLMDFLAITLRKR